MPRAEEVDRLFVQQPDAVELLGGRVRRLVVIVIPVPHSVRMQLKPRSTVSAIRISRALKMLLGPVLNSPKFQNEMARRFCPVASAARVLSAPPGAHRHRRAEKGSDSELDCLAASKPDGPWLVVFHVVAPFCLECRVYVPDPLAYTHS
jgi:hypothetical protein